jgi:CMP-N,N'-diacetyllegionaminic acid synthase
MKTLIVIPARAGSKGLPGKNSRKLGDKSLIEYSIDFALKIKKKEDIVCISTDDEVIIELCYKYENVVILKRPKYLSNDKAGMSDVLKHCLGFFKKKRQVFDLLFLLQPTSPFRIENDFNKMYSLLDLKTDMVVSVKESKANPYFNLFEENKLGYLRKSKPGEYKSRQTTPKVYEYNGSMYLIKVISFLSFGLHGIKNIKKLVMPSSRSIDIDNICDWIIAEYYLENLNELQ